MFNFALNKIHSARALNKAREREIPRDAAFQRWTPPSSPCSSPSSFLRSAWKTGRFSGSFWCLPITLSGTNIPFVFGVTELLCLELCLSPTYRSPKEKRFCHPTPRKQQNGPGQQDRGRVPIRPAKTDEKDSRTRANVEAKKSAHLVGRERRHRPFAPRRRFETENVSKERAATVRFTAPSETIETSRAEMESVERKSAGEFEED